MPTVASIPRLPIAAMRSAGRTLWRRIGRYCHRRFQGPQRPQGQEKAGAAGGPDRDCESRCGETGAAYACQARSRDELCLDADAGGGEAEWRFRLEQNDVVGNPPIRSRRDRRRSKPPRRMRNRPTCRCRRAVRSRLSRSRRPWQPRPANRRTRRRWPLYRREPRLSPRLSSEPIVGRTPAGILKIIPPSRRGRAFRGPASPRHRR